MGDLESILESGQRRMFEQRSEISRELEEGDQIKSVRTVVS